MSAEIEEMYDYVLKSSLDLKEKRKLLDDIRKLRGPQDNRWNYWYVIYALAFLALSVPVYAFWQLGKSGTTEIPQAMLSIAATSVGALAGFLMRQERGGSREPATPGKP